MVWLRERDVGSAKHKLDLWLLLAHLVCSDLQAQRKNKNNIK